LDERLMQESGPKLLEPADQLPGAIAAYLGEKFKVLAARELPGSRRCAGAKVRTKGGRKDQPRKLGAHNLNLTFTRAGVSSPADGDCGGLALQMQGGADRWSSTEVLRLSGRLAGHPAL